MLAGFAHDKLQVKSAHLLKIVLVDIKTSDSDVSRPRLNQACIVYICSIEPQTQSGLALLLLSVDVDIGLNQACRCCSSCRFYRKTDYVILYSIMICY